MGELARRTRERELAVSRGHLQAAAVGVTLVAISAFALGYSLGHGGEGSEPLARTTLGSVADGTLVKVLARVEATNDPTGGVGVLSFPDVLAAELSIPEDEGVEGEPTVGLEGTADAELPGMDVVVEAAGVDGLEAFDTLPLGAYTVDLGRFGDLDAAVALRDRVAELEGAEVWLTAEVVDGQRAYRVGWGAFAEQAHAREVYDELAAEGVPCLGVAELP
jgi:hypothetical protein